MLGPRGKSWGVELMQGCSTLLLLFGLKSKSAPEAGLRVEFGVFWTSKKYI